MTKRQEINDRWCSLKHSLRILRLKSSAMEILKRVKQSDVLAAILFTLLIARVIEQPIREAPVAYAIGGLQISSINYADDIAVVNQHDTAQLQHFIDSLAVNSKSIGLNINTKKTNSFSISKNKEPLNI